MHLLCAKLFDREILELGGGSEMSTQAPGKLRLHLQLLRDNAVYRFAYYAQDHLADWTAIERFFSSAFAQVEEKYLLQY